MVNACLTIYHVLDEIGKTTLIYDDFFRPVIQKISFGHFS